jgi:hypothetical protein
MVTQGQVPRLPSGAKLPSAGFWAAQSLGGADTAVRKASHPEQSTAFTKGRHLRL